MLTRQTSGNISDEATTSLGNIFPEAMRTVQAVADLEKGAPAGCCGRLRGRPAFSRSCSLCRMARRTTFRNGPQRIPALNRSARDLRR
jgi:hypothetical protein